MKKAATTMMNKEKTEWKLVIFVDKMYNTEKKIKKKLRSVRKRKMMKAHAQGIRATC